ncbi:MAG: hypothetical protein JJU30_02195 [Alkalimonas sp.]|nr:hypothetical protein [Alkalimonas sp.]
MLRATAVLASLLLLAACQSTGERTAMNSSAGDVVDEEGVRYVCRMVREAGSNLRRRSCVTEEEFRLRQDDAREALRRAAANDRGHIDDN